MKNQESVIQKLAELLQQSKHDTSFNEGVVVYNGESFQLPKSASTTGGKRTTNLKYR